jgi:hypothetical protein
VVPQLAGTKHPCVRWKPFQQRLPTEEELRGWFARWRHAGLAVVLGPVSGLFAIDVDGHEAYAALLDKLGEVPRGPTVLSGSGEPHRFHVYFKCPDVPTLARFTPWHKHLEFRGDRGIIVLPPSLHKSGNAYRFAPGQSFDDLPLPELPPLIVEELVARSSRMGARPLARPGSDPEVASISKLGLTAVQRRARRYIAHIPPAVAGQGGDRLTYKVACRLVLGFGLRTDEAMPLLREYSLRCSPPWSEAELLHKLERAGQEPGERGYLLHRVREKGVRAFLHPGTPQTGPAGVSPAVPPLPTLARLRDFGMVDPERARLFEVVGASHGLFEGIGTWPDYNKLWAQIRAGGDAGLPAAVRQIVLRKEGLVWRTRGGTDWAVRLVPAAGGPRCDEYLGVGFCLQTAGYLLRREAKHACPALSVPPAAPGAIPAGEAREQMSRVANGLRLFRTARALLWYVHARVLDRGHSTLLLSDVELAEVVWGAAPAAWPANWRQHLFTTLASLTAIRVGRVSVVGQQVQTHLAGAKGVLLSAVEDRRARKGLNDCCSPGCTHWHSAGAHHHFVVTIAPEGFLGRLAGFAVEGEDGPDGCRHFNFHPDLGAKLRQAKELVEQESDADWIEDDAERSKRLREEKRALKEQLEAVRAGHHALFKGIVSTALLPLIFGDLIGLTAEGRAILRTLTREVTRASRKQRPRRQDSAHVFTEGRVPDTRTGASFVCRLLAPPVGFVGFNGNGRNWGRGYRLATWMRRAGFPVPDGEREFRARVGAFLKEVAGLAGLLGIVPVGVRGHEVFDLEELREMARLAQQRPLHTLRSPCLRLYVREDYLARWRQLAAEAVTGHASPEPDPGQGLVDLRVALRRAGVKQGELAAHLNRSRSFVNKLLNGKPWPEELLARTRAFLASRGHEGPAL